MKTMEENSNVQNGGSLLAASSGGRVGSTVNNKNNSNNKKKMMIQTKMHCSLLQKSLHQKGDETTSSTADTTTTVSNPTTSESNHNNNGTTNNTLSSQRRALKAKLRNSHVSRCLKQHQSASRDEEHHSSLLPVIHTHYSDLSSIASESTDDFEETELNDINTLVNIGTPEFMDKRKTADHDDEASPAFCKTGDDFVCTPSTMASTKSTFADCSPPDFQEAITDIPQCSQSDIGNEIQPLMSRIYNIIGQIDGTTPNTPTTPMAYTFCGCLSQIEKDKDFRPAPSLSYETTFLSSDEDDTFNGTLGTKSTMDDRNWDETNKTGTGTNDRSSEVHTLKNAIALNSDNELFLMTGEKKTQNNKAVNEKTSSSPTDQNTKVVVNNNTDDTVNSNMNLKKVTSNHMIPPTDDVVNILAILNDSHAGMKQKKNACNGLKVISFQPQNSSRLIRTVGVLSCITSVLHESNSNCFDTKTLKSKDLLDCRNRLLLVVLNMVEVEKNRTVLFQQSDLMIELTAIINTAKDESLPLCLLILARLAKAPENRLSWSQHPETIDALMSIVKRIPDTFVTTNNNNNNNNNDDDDDKYNSFNDTMEPTSEVISKANKMAFTILNHLCKVEDNAVRTFPKFFFQMFVFCHKLNLYFATLLVSKNILCSDETNISALVDIVTNEKCSSKTDAMMIFVQLTANPDVPCTPLYSREELIKVTIDGTKSKDNAFKKNSFNLLLNMTSNEENIGAIRKKNELISTMFKCTLDDSCAQNQLQAMKCVWNLANDSTAAEIMRKSTYAVPTLKYLTRDNNTQIDTNLKQLALATLESLTTSL